MGNNIESTFPNKTFAKNPFKTPTHKKTTDVAFNTSDTKGSLQDNSRNILKVNQRQSNILYAQTNNTAPATSHNVQQLVATPNNIAPSDPFTVHNNEKKYRTIIKEKEQWKKEDYAAQYKCNLSASLAASPLKSISPKKLSLPDFPTDALPQDIATFVHEVCHKYNQPSALVAPIILGISSVACRGKLIVKRNNEHYEPITLYMLALAESGTGKTPLLKIIQQPLYDHEKQERDKITDGSFKSVAPMYCIFKTTPQALEKVMHEQKGIIGIVGSEAGPLKYITHKNDDLFLMGYDGEPYRSLKVKGSPIIQRPCVSICIIAQKPSVQQFLQDKEMQEDGLIGRFLIAIPNSSMQTAPPDEITPNIKATWHNTLTHILNIEHNEAPHILELSRAAHDEWINFAQAIISKGQTKAKSTAVRSFYRKLAGTTLRIAGLLHILAGHTQDEQISYASMSNAIRIASFFDAHTIAALDSAEDSNVKLAQKVIKFLAQKREHEISVRDIYRYFHVKRAEIEPVLKILEQHNYIAISKENRSESCLIHPSIRFLSDQRL